MVESGRDSGGADETRSYMCSLVKPGTRNPDCVLGESSVLIQFPEQFTEIQSKSGQDISAIQRNLNAVARTLSGKGKAAYDGIQEGLGGCDYS